MDTLRLANPNRPGHQVQIELADDDGEPETASCTCGADWEQCTRDTAWTWSAIHVPPPVVIRGRIIGRPA